jgi:hypothetical protein
VGIERENLMKIKVCKDDLEQGAEVGEMRSANELLQNRSALMERFAKDGYLLLRGFHPRDEVMAAREAILGAMDEKGLEALSPHNRDIAQLPEVLQKGAPSEKMKTYMEKL